MVSISSPEREITSTLAGFCSRLQHTDLTPEAAATAQRCLLDWLGVTVAGSTQRSARIVRESALAQGGISEAVVIGSPHALPEAQAALVNGVAGHALDFDDKHFDIPGHPSAPIMPAVLAVAEARAMPGCTVLSSVVAAVEVMCRVGLLVGQQHYDAGWHATGTIGGIGAAAGAARVLGLSPEETAIALGLAATQASGLKGTFGSMSKALNVGRAASVGVLSADLARRGFRGPTDLLSAAQGFGPTYAAVPNDAAARAGLGCSFAICGVKYKYHAACYATHALIECALQLRGELPPGQSDIESVQITVPPTALRMCVIPSPRTGVEAQFSVSQVTAMALLGVDTSDITAFSTASCSAPEIVALREKCRVAAGEHLAAGSGELRVDLRTGGQLFAAVDLRARTLPVQEQQRKVEAKFLTLTRNLLSAEHQHELIAIVTQLRGLDDIRKLTRLLRAPH
jgi:2-methylcitrate dehydratase PrpD